MSIPFPILDNTFFKDQFLITSYQIDSVASLTANKPPAHPGRLHPFLGQVMAALRDRDAAPGFDSPRCYCPPPIRFPEHVRFMTAEEILARWGWGEQEAAESPEYYGRLVDKLRATQADEATAERAWERLALHGWDNGAYFHFRDEDEDEAVIGTPADLDLDDEEGDSASIGDPADVAVHNEGPSTTGDPADVDWEDEPSDDDDDGDVTMGEGDASASASPTLPNGLTEEDLAGFDPVIRANILRLAAQDAEEDNTGIEDIDEVSGWAVPPAEGDDELIDDEIRAWATGPSEWEDYEEEDEEEYEEGWETDDDGEDHDSEENGNEENDEDDEILWPGWAAPGVGYPDPHDHAFPMYLVPHVMHENAWEEGGSTQYVYVRGGLVCCEYSGSPRRFENCQGRRVEGGVEDGVETDEEMDMNDSDEE